MDTDKTNGLNLREFRSACRSYGYQGDIVQLFTCLDQHGPRNMLAHDEVAFLDNWDILDDPTDLTAVPLEAVAAPEGVITASKFETLGPGSYTLDSCFGAQPWTVGARHGGSFSFGAKGPIHYVKPTVGPVDYQPTDGWSSARHRKPSWAFGDNRGPPPQVLYVPRTASRPPSRSKPPLSARAVG